MVMYTEQVKHFTFTKEDSDIMDKIFEQFNVTPVKIVVVLKGPDGKDMLNSTYFCFENVDTLDDIAFDVGDAWFEIFNTDDLGREDVFSTEDDMNQFLNRKMTHPHLYTVYENHHWNYF